MSTYFRILDRNLIARQESMFDCFIFDPQKGWQKDTNNILMDRLVGYNTNSIGNFDVMSMIEQITEEEALAAIQQ